MGNTRIEITNNSFSVLRDIIEKAGKYVYLTSFLFYDEKIADLLVEKSKSGVSVELLTTPSDAARSDELKEWATRLQKRLQSSGVKTRQTNISDQIKSTSSRNTDKPSKNLHLT